jgi:hypothetical protein
VATAVEITFAVTGLGSSTVLLSTRKIPVSMNQVDPPTTRNLSSSACRPASSRHDRGMSPDARSTRVTRPT